ncbi:GNAT family N-acetyltransferase [Nitrobacter vulgaris]|jgi:CelD/BcsL family acetyltransferase involved in cellulose biosynthesis|uniref:GNAT family N-acetyltransferase n=1 Tax=Nitrobacter vulgaris TaxID=29421 RepID=A0A1V4HZF2_NITVU|nr:GNAT family N-acetyltransferase [Nitrobacter vulgaris]OPH83356.1 GNAT family N-acetyltransferase [Nitrobacter vulgaris]
MVDIVNWAPARGSSRRGFTARPSASATRRGAAALATLDPSRWRSLADRAVEPNGYYLADWELALDASARDRTNASALTARSDLLSDKSGSETLIGLIPVISAWRAYRIPLPLLVSADPYGTLCTPLLDHGLANQAAAALLREARTLGQRALILRNIALDGAAMKAITTALEHDGLKPHRLHGHVRACLDATREAEELLREALGVKKLKELRRQRNRLAEHGEVSFQVARSTADVARALETFLALEASGWKAQRGTALIQHSGDAAFIRRAAPALAKRGQCEIVTLHAGPTPVAAAVVLRHQDRAFYFKLGVDERFAKFSPGVQLTLDLTRHLCADPAITLADSTANPGHPMIDPIWRGRLAIGDVLIPLRRNDPAVPLAKAAISLRRLLREPARRVVNIVRERQEKNA